MSTNIGINDKNRAAVGRLLNTLLADEFVLYTKLRNYHWNVKSPNFSELHKFFEGQYDAVDQSIDEVAERARAVGERSAGSMREFLGLARLKEETGRAVDAKTMLKNTLNDHEALIRSLRKDLQTSAEKHGDMGTSDFLTGLMEEHEKMAWMTRAFLEGK
jgi:starvation-inducible DNA-binding protein